MKLRTPALVLILTTAVQASVKLDVFVENSGSVPLQVLAPAETFAARILATADVSIAWHTSASSARKAPNRVIVLHFQGSAPATSTEGALGYSLLHQDHATIFYGQIRRVASDNQQAYVLAHAMAHEIVHLLQGVPRHSTTGVMKAHWDGRDIFEMRHLFVLTPEDIRLIRHMSEPSSLSGSVMY